jgi:serine/threonine-protein kinase
MGEVYEAADRVLDRTVAIKVLRPSLASDGRSGARFEREARTAARLSHARIVAVFDAGRHDDRVFIVMEHVAGSTLVEVLRQQGALPGTTVAAVGADIADALAHAHERGVVHRDVTPGNVMLDRDGHAKVLDFGIARAAQRVPSSTSVHGTVAYAAPEVLSGHHGDQRVDVYGLGAVLYELLTGTPPFRGDGAAIARRLEVQRPVPVRGWNPAVPDELDDLVLRLLAYDAAERPDDLSAVARTLRGIAASPTAAATAPIVALVPARDAETQPSAHPVVSPTRRLDGERAPLAVGSPQLSKERRWRPKLVRVTAWLAFLGAFASAGAIVVPAMLGAAQPVHATAEPPARLPAPTGVTATTSCDGWLSTGTDVSWEPVAGATGYEIWRRGSADDTFTRLEPVGADVTAVRDVDLGVDMTYTYRVRAVDPPAVGAWSAAAVARTPLFCLT